MAQPKKIHPHLGGQYHPKKVYSRVEVEKQKTAIEQAFVKGFTFSQIIRFMKEQFGVGDTRTKRLLSECKEEFIRNTENSRDADRAVAIRRIQRIIQDHDERLNATTPTVIKNGRTRQVVELPISNADFAKLSSSMRGWESLLADLQGTLAPIKVDVNVQVSHAVMAVIADMAPEEVQNHLSDYAEQERQAALYRALTAPNGSNGTNGKAA